MFGRNYQRKYYSKDKLKNKLKKVTFIVKINMHLSKKKILEELKLKKKSISDEYEKLIFHFFFIFFILKRK